MNPPNRPNIILICVDQWRGDCLSIDGHPVVHTPYLDDLALNGVRFSRAYAAVPSCIAARASLMTGLTPRSHGRVGYRDGVPWDYPVTLAGEFTRHGYQTQAIGKMHVYPERSQIGFQNVILHDGFLHHAHRQHPIGYEAVDDYEPWLRGQLGRDATDFDHGLNCNSFVARPWDRPEHLHPTNFVVTQAIDFLRRRDPRKPFFLLMSFHRPHPPLDPPAWAFEQYAGRDMPEPPRGDWIEAFAEHDATGRSSPLRATMDGGVLRRARAAYYGQMSHIDHQINRFLETLAIHGQAANSYVCFVSDHGEMLGDHLFFRKQLPYEGSARVPLILSGPKGSGLGRNTVRREAVELMDIMPTLLECAGLPVPAGVEGRSLLGLARGGNVTWRDFIHGEHAGYGGSVHYLTDGRMKYVWLSGSGLEQLFDLDADPQELHELSRDASRSAQLAVWRERLTVELAGREEGFVQEGKLAAGRPVRPVLHAVAPMDGGAIHP